MALVQQLKSLIGEGGETTYRYECADCGAEFESPAKNPNETECHECGSDRVHTAA